jgi:hypothetical protein
MSPAFGYAEDEMTKLLHRLLLVVLSRSYHQCLLLVYGIIIEYAVCVLFANFIIVMYYQLLASHGVAPPILPREPRFFVMRPSHSNISNMILSLSSL